MLFQRTQDQFPAVIPGDATFFYLGTLIHVVCTHNIHTRAHTHSHTNYNKDLVDGSLIKRYFLPIPATCIPFQYTHSGVLHVVFWPLHVLWHTYKHPNKCFKKNPQNLNSQGILALQYTSVIPAFWRGRQIKKSSRLVPTAWKLSQKNQNRPSNKIK